LFLKGDSQFFVAISFNRYIPWTESGWFYQRALLSGPFEDEFDVVSQLSFDTPHQDQIVADVVEELRFWPHSQKRLWREVRRAVHRKEAEKAGVTINHLRLPVTDEELQQQKTAKYKLLQRRVTENHKAALMKTEPIIF
jgi:hypothetical protein